VSLLSRWDEVKERADWQAILIGNGFSRHIWSGFDYKSLYDVATASATPLGPQEQAVFRHLGTHDFEYVLRVLHYARSVNQALGLDVEKVTRAYRAVQQGLGAAVARTHIPWDMVPRPVLEKIRSTLLKYRLVFSTNYDLLIYWSIVCGEQKPHDVKDYFWTRRDERWLSFNLFDTDTPGGVTRVLYLHGGLHIYRLPDGVTAKYVPDMGESLLDSFQRFMHCDDLAGPLPLIVTEGTSADKRREIQSDPYLSFAYQQLATYDGPIVIFGHRLGGADDHIVEALRSAGRRPVAISLRRGSEKEMMQRQARYCEKLPEACLYFFDAASHPLGSESLKVLPPDSEEPGFPA